MSQANTTAETLALMKDAQSAPNNELAKAFLQSGSAIQGITAYDLEAPAKKLYPVITPLRNRIPRVSGKGGIQANWRSITGINTGGISAGVGQGNRGGVIATSTTARLCVRERRDASLSRVRERAMNAPGGPFAHVRIVVNPASSRPPTERSSYSMTLPPPSRM